MNIAFCINRLGIIGLGVTISSLIRNCSDHSRLRLWFLCSDLTKNDKKQITRHLESESFTGNYQILDFDPKRYFSSFNSLHGDWTPYGRLLLVDFINADQVLYLDSDLVVEVDVLEIDSFDFQGHVIAAVGGGRFKYTLGNNFYIDTLGLSPESEYFNSGVLFLNLKEWRLKNVKEKCLEVAEKHSMDLPSHDQSLLNIYCKGNFAKLPQSFNCEWQAHLSKPEVSNKMILHFIGSPKPWDPFGLFLNNGYSTYKKYLNPEWNSLFGSLTPLTFKRAWKIRRSYMRCIINKIKSRKLVQV